MAFNVGRFSGWDQTPANKSGKQTFYRYDSRLAVVLSRATRAPGQASARLRLSTTSGARQSSLTPPHSSRLECASSTMRPAARGSRRSSTVPLPPVRSRSVAAERSMVTVHIMLLVRCTEAGSAFSPKRGKASPHPAERRQSPPDLLQGNVGLLKWLVGAPAADRGEVVARAVKGARWAQVHS